MGFLKQVHSPDRPFLLPHWANLEAEALASAPSPPKTEKSALYMPGVEIFIDMAAEAVRGSVHSYSTSDADESCSE